MPLVLLALMLLLGACAPSGPRVIAYDAESCGFCRMTISDPRFGTELMTATGKLYTFDSIECLAAFAASQTTPPRGAWVSDWAHPGTLVAVDSAEFRRVDGPAGSPMGKGLVATRRGAGGRGVMRWADVLVLARAELRGGAEVAGVR